MLSQHLKVFDVLLELLCVFRRWPGMVQGLSGNMRLAHLASQRAAHLHL